MTDAVGSKDRVYTLKGKLATDLKNGIVDKERVCFIQEGATRNDVWSLKKYGLKKGVDYLFFKGTKKVKGKVVQTLIYVPIIRE